MAALFITGTGTGIGKTFVTAGLVRHLREIGLVVDAVKPVLSGFEDGAAAESDAGILAAALGRTANACEIPRIAPFRFKAALSPDMAAKAEGKTLDFDALLRFSRSMLKYIPDALLIEGVGGVMSPLTERHTVLDWMAALRLPTLLVAGSYLGTISHTLTAVAVLKERGLNIGAIVVSESEDSTVPLNDTVDDIGRFVPEVPVVALRRLRGGETDPAFARLADLFWPR